MIRSLFRRDPRRGQIDALYEKVVETARHPTLYARLGIPDTIEGRFEAVALHLVVVLRRLRKLPAPAADVAQELIDHFFRQMDAAMRETGVGDMGVPKRMKKLAAAFYGRAQAYDRGLDAADRHALAEEFANHRIGAAGVELADYAIALDKHWSDATLNDLLAPGPKRAFQPLEEAAS